MKIVIIGPSSSGKSKIIEELKNKGHNVLTESAREVLEKYKYEKTTNQIILKRQLEMLTMQLDKENDLKNSNNTFLDRGIIDYIVYTIHYGINPKIEGFKDIDLYYRYDKVFSLEGLPFIKDNIRTEKNYSEAKSIYNNILETYKKYCHEIITVPIFSNDETENILKRTEYILKNII